jgi:hypothetical protein
MLIKNFENSGIRSQAFPGAPIVAPIVLSSISNLFFEMRGCPQRPPVEFSFVSRAACSIAGEALAKISQIGLIIRFDRQSTSIAWTHMAIRDKIAPNFQSCGPQLLMRHAADYAVRKAV